MLAIQYQSSQQVTNVLDTGNGLSNNIVHSTFQDRDGFIWIATESGLNRFDGYNIVTFFNQHGDTLSLSSNTIRSFVEDKNGTLWIGSYNGLNEYDPVAHSFKRYSELPELPTSRLDLQEMVYDEEAHRIWFNTIQTTGWFDIESHTFHFLPKDFESFSMTKHEKGVLVLTKNQEIYLIDRSDESLSLVGKIDGEPLNPIHFGKISKQLWVPSSILSEDQKQVEWESLPNELNSKQLTSLLEINSSKIWIGTDEGLFEYDRVTNVLTQISLSEEPSFLINSIQSLSKDREAGIWVGTLGGLFYFNSAESPFQHVDFSSGTGDVIMGMNQDEKTALINIFSRDIAVMSLENYAIVELPISSELTDEELQVWDIQIVNNSSFRYWFGTNAGLILYDPDSKKIEKRYFDQPYSQAIFSIEASDEAAIYVSTLSDIHKLDRNDGTLIRTISTVDFVKQSNIQDLLLIDNWMYVATEGEGLAKVDIDSGQILEITDAKNQEESPLKNNAIWDIYLGEENKLWIGTSRGLYSYDLDSEVLNHINFDDFISNRIVYSMLEFDSDIWLGTEQGLIRVSKNEERYNIYGANEGVLNYEFNRRSALKILDGKFLFGGVEGLTIFDPSAINQALIQPPLHILDMTVYQQDSSFTPLNFTDQTIDLAWDQNTIEFSFAALNYFNPQAMRYRYRLVGLEENWVMDRSSRRPRYAQLPPGEYEFEVESALTSSFSKATSSSVFFKINPPFWQTNFFRAAIISVILFIIWLIYRYRLESLLEVERVRLRIARDLHDEVGSGLSGIALAGDILTHKMEKQSNGEVDDIRKITLNARAMASSLDGIVWLIDSNKETLGDLIAKCRSVSKELLINHQLIFESDLTAEQNDIILSSETKRHLFLFFKEAVNNLHKHASANSATIKFSFDGNTFHFNISDDGQGFDTSLIKKGNGLDSMHHRASEIGAILNIDSEISIGTTLELRLKLPESRYS